jgi:ATP-dependent DNA ligase
MYWRSRHDLARGNAVQSVASKRTMVLIGNRRFAAMARRSSERLSRRLAPTGVQHEIKHDGRRLIVRREGKAV